MNYYKIIVSYDGIDYSGWQEQSHAFAVVNALQKSFYDVFKYAIKVVGASRTDAGVHAYGQVARFGINFSIETDKLIRAWNNFLPRDIVIRNIEKVDNKFHPQRDVVEKTYYYHFFLKRPLPFYSRYGLFYKNRIDLCKLKKALQVFVGTHDFRSFCTGYDQATTVRTINSIKLEYKQKYGAYRIIIKGPSFLRYMIRRIVGACLAVSSSDKKDVGDLKKALAEKNPHQHLPTAPAHGLMLYHIQYK